MYVSVSLHTSITIEKCVSAKHQHCRHTPEYTLLIFPCHWILNGFNVGICEKEGGGGGESEQLQFMGNFYVFSCHSVAYYWNRNKIALKLIGMFGYCEFHSSSFSAPSLNTEHTKHMWKIVFYFNFLLNLLSFTFLPLLRISFSSSASIPFAPP